MTIVLSERFDSGSSQTGGDKQIQRTWRITGENDLATALADFESDVAASYGGLDLDSVNVEFYAEDGTNVTWLGTATYKRRPRAIFEPVTNNNFYSFDTGGASEQITHSLGTSDTDVAAGVAAADHKNAINVQEGIVGGIDIGIASFNWQETHYISDADMTDAYMAAIAAASWHVNSDGFLLRKGGSTTLAAGSVLFQGASGSQRDEGDWEITFSFAFSQNRTGLSVGDISGIDKLGWEYLWIETRPVVDGGRTVQRAAQANVEQVYYTAAFSTLAIR